MFYWKIRRALRFAQEHDRRIRLYQEKMQEIFGEKYKKDLEIEKRRKSDE